MYPRLSVTLNIDGTEVSFEEAPAPFDVKLTVPDDGFRYIQTLHDDQFVGGPRQLLNGWADYEIPAMMNEVYLKGPDDPSIPLKYRNKTYDYVDMPVRWQWFLFDLWRAYVPGPIPDGKYEGSHPDPLKRPRVIRFDHYTSGSAKWIYEYMIEISRSNTDDRPPEKGWRDDVLQRYMTAPGPYSWLFKTMTGNIHRVIRKQGKYLICEAIDIRKPCPSIESLKGQHHLIHFATNQGTEKFTNGRYKVSRFPAVNAACRIHGYPDSGTPVPVLSWNGEVGILEERTVELLPGQPFSMYYPPK